jgi:hypothetical protein
VHKIRIRESSPGTVANCGEKATHPNVYHKDTKGIYKEDKKMRHNCHKKKHIKRDYGNLKAVNAKK